MRRNRAGRVRRANRLRGGALGLVIAVMAWPPHLISVLAATPEANSNGAADPYLWLEDVYGGRAMEWVKAQNAKTNTVLENDPHYRSLLDDAKNLEMAEDRIPEPRVLGGKIYNFWQDAAHQHGIWRETTLENYQTPSPTWRTMLDLDSLSSTERGNWFWKGAICREPAENRCMLNLSDGGEDAVTLREFDLESGAFVKGGFSLPRGKQDLAWESPDTLLVAREWTPGEVTQSGYAFVVKRIKRGEPLSAAVEVFRGTPHDVLVGPLALDDGAGHHAVVIQRGVSFFESEFYLVGRGHPAKLEIPPKADLSALVDGRLIVNLHQEWKRDGHPTLPQGSLVSIDLAAATADPLHLRPTLIYAPGPREAFVETRATAGHLLVNTLDNVNGRLFAYQPEPGGLWSRKQLPVPESTSVDLVDANPHSETAFATLTGFLTPPRLMLTDVHSGTLAQVKALPAKFDASRDVVEQFEATSNDGTRIPYFIVHPADMKADGSTPTILSAYGGFEVPMRPKYSPKVGKLWLERGGSFVLANIRGGGEFGPAWHEAGLKTHRQRIYDDFAAVGKEIIAKGFTNPARLGIRGGSNGGLLMGVEMTQHPELWNAVDIEIPLLDMLRFEQIAAGSSWVGEYGSVANPDERSFLAAISPYNNLKPGVRYPEALIWSTTKDDRVGPQHARKFAAKLEAMGVPYLYYEVTEGGHGSGATLLEAAEMDAREYTYFARKLVPDGVH
jgi:prolyl oligopeptidase